MRLRFTFTKSMWVDIGREEGQRLLDADDYTELVEAATRAQRIAAQAGHHVGDAYIVVERYDEGDYVDADPIEWDDREKYLWSARHFVNKARYELSCGRYREGHCPDLDRVNRDLGRLEEQLRLMALAVDNPAHPEVLAAMGAKP